MASEPSLQNKANTAFEKLVRAMANKNKNEASLTPLLATATAAIRNLKAVAPVAANVPQINVGPSRPSFFKRMSNAAVNKLVNIKGRLTGPRVKAEGENLVKALSIAQRLRRKGGVRGVIGQIAKGPVLAVEGMSTMGTRVGAFMGEMRAKVGAPTNSNYQKTINRYRKLSKQGFTVNNSNLKVALALKNNGQKNVYISWPIMYTGNKNTTKYASNTVNYARRKAGSNLRVPSGATGSSSVPLKFTNQNKNLLNKLALVAEANRRGVLKTNVKNYATLKRLLGGQNATVAKFIGTNENFMKLARAAGMEAGLGAVADAVAEAAAAKAESNKAAALKALMSKLYPGVNYSKITGNTPMKKALALRLAGNIKNVKLNNNQRSLLGTKNLAVYNAAMSLRSIPKVGNKIQPRNAGQAKIILNAANLHSVINVTKKDNVAIKAIKARLNAAGINGNKYDFSKINKSKLSTAQQQLAAEMINERGLIKDVIKKLPTERTPSEAIATYSKIKGMTIPGDLEGDLNVAKTAALKMIKDYKLADFVKLFWDKTSGKGAGATWKPKITNKKQLESVINSTKAALKINNTGLTAIKNGLGLTAGPILTYMDLESALKKAITNGKVGKGTFGGNNKNKNNHKQFFLNVMRNKIRDPPPQNANYSRRIARYFE